MVIYDGNGEVVAAEPSGFASAPDPLPEVPASMIENPAPGKVVTVPAVERIALVQSSRMKPIATAQCAWSLHLSRRSIEPSQR